MKQGNQILVDKEFKIITGSIDWEWAHITPLVPAFNSPIDLLPVREINNAAVDLVERMRRSSRACSEANAIKIWQKVCGMAGCILGLLCAVDMIWLTGTAFLG